MASDFDAPQKKTLNGLGLAGLIVGVVGGILGVIPCVGVVGIPVALIGIILAGIGLIMAFSNKRWGTGLAIAGVLVSVLALIVSGGVFAATMYWAKTKADEGIGELKKGIKTVDDEMRRQAELNTNDVVKRAQQVEEVRNAQGTPVINAIDLRKEFNANVAGSNKKYRGTIVEIRGVVEMAEVRSATMFGDVGTVTLQTFDPGKVVRCHFDRAQEGDMRGLKPGDTVTIRGKYHSEEFANPNVIRCIVVKGP